MPAIDINDWMARLLDSLAPVRQRQLVSLQGPRDWCDRQFESLSRKQPDMLVLSNRQLGADPIPFSKADTCLGGEAGIVVLDLFEGFNPDVLCIAAGLVRAGGVLLLLSPAVNDWDLSADRYACWQDRSRSPRARFVEYFFAQLDADPDIGLTVTPQQATNPLPMLPSLSATEIMDGKTAEQSSCLQRIGKWLPGKRAGVVLLSADRGRGKSSCLGLLVESLRADNRVAVCANSRRNAAALLSLAPEALFMAPDRLLQERPELNLLVIDEAAMIPLSLLRRMTRLYPRIVMATTSGGYEGTGRGFMLRFISALDTTRLLRLELRDPVRWCRGDLLESCLERVLKLDSGGDVDIPDLSVSGESETEMLEEPGAPQSGPTLEQVYRLLNTAHYRTRPSDLRMLMENPDQRLIVARVGRQVVGAILLNLEGGLDDELCEQVFLGRRRPQGHLLAQMLTAQAGLRRFATRRGLRVQRIAVDEAWRRRGVGTQLIQAALAEARRCGFDYLGASFAFDLETVNFWRQTGFELVHVSFAQGKSSGDHSIAVLQALKPGLDDDLERMKNRLGQQLPVWMTQFLQDMDPQQVAALLRYAIYDPPAGEFENEDVEAFARGNKGFETCFVNLQRFVMRRVARDDDKAQAGFDDLLVEKAIQNRDWNRLDCMSAQQGRKQIQNRMRELIATELGLDNPASQ